MRLNRAGVAYMLPSNVRDRKVTDSNLNRNGFFNYSLTSLCRSGRDPEKYFDIGMVRLNQMGIMGSQHFGQIISFKKNAYLQAFPFTI